MSTFDNLFDLDSKLDKILRLFNNRYPWRYFYRGILPKFIRNPINQRLDFAKQYRIHQAWKIMLDAYFSGNLVDFNLVPRKNFKNQKIIWQYWGQDCTFEQLPETVQICFNSIDKYKGDYRVIRLNDNNIKEYIEFPEFVYERRLNPDFKYAFFADLLRLALLDIYGGIWIDATILLTAPIDHDLVNLGYFMFHRDSNSENRFLWGKYDNYFNWDNRHYIKYLNSFIIARRNEPVIHVSLNMLLYFWKTQRKIPHYFFFQIMLDCLEVNYGFKPNILIDDTFPHLLQRVIKKEFNLSYYHQILNKTHIHKLTYTKKYNDNSYFSYLKKEFIS